MGMARKWKELNDEERNRYFTWISKVTSHEEMFDAAIEIATRERPRIEKGEISLFSNNKHEWTLVSIYHSKGSSEHLMSNPYGAIMDSWKYARKLCKDWKPGDPIDPPCEEDRA